MKLTILQIEDSEEDAALLVKVFKRAGVKNPVVTLRNGDAAIRYLKGEGVYAARDRFPLPGILLVDLKLPGISGLELLEWVRDQPHLKDVLVLAISGYDELWRVKRAYASGARSFLTKPFIEEDVRNLVKVFSGYWVVEDKAARANHQHGD
jgi:CheY-like chemotaxis protein